MKKSAVLMLVAGACAAGILLILAYHLWDPGPSTAFCYDKKSNGIWIGHQWYTGLNVRTGEPVSARERDDLIAYLYRYRIKYVFIHAGPVKTDGTIADMPGHFFKALKRLTPDICYLPWLGGNARMIRLADPSWRSSFLQMLASLHSAGFDGVHLDFEPLADFHPGYLELLQEIRSAFERDFFISHATRRVNLLRWKIPVLSDRFWSQDFYSACMRRSDQTVLMGYDTCLKFKKAYIAFMREQTAHLCRLALAVTGHRVIIGIPSYEDVPKLSDPRVENIKNAVLGVRAALESNDTIRTVFDGVAVYAHWTTDVSEWKYYEIYWLSSLR